MKIAAEVFPKTFQKLLEFCPIECFSRKSFCDSKTLVQPQEPKVANTMRPQILSPETDLPLMSVHASQRMEQRRISPDDIATVIRYGRVLYANGAVFFIVGRHEIERFCDIAEIKNLDGVHVVCNHLGVVITAYRNRNFQTKSLRDRNRCRGPRRASFWS